MNSDIEAIRNNHRISDLHGSTCLGQDSAQDVPEDYLIRNEGVMLELDMSLDP